jgi:glycosyltransferase involved in cell wall biosynthesis
LHVGFDAHLLSRSRSYRDAGISRHIRNVLAHLPAAGADAELTVFAGPDGAPEPPPTANGHFHVRISRLRTERPTLRVLWEQAVAPIELARLGIDVIHGPAYVLPLAAPCAGVVTVHDLSFLRLPGLFHRANQAYLATMTRLAVAAARRVIAVSASTRRELVELLGVPESKVTVIPNGVEPVFRPLPAHAVAAFRTRAGLPEQFILFMSTLEPRKNVSSLVRAYAELRHRHDLPHALVLAGGKGWLYEAIFAEVQALGLEGQVLFPGYVPFDEQPLWYNAAAAFAYPSLYEGFGMPPLEAMACGTPVVCACTTSLPEVVGEAGLMVEPSDVSSLADALWQLVSDEPLRRRLRAAGPARAAQFDWRTIARQTFDVYRAAA